MRGSITLELKRNDFGRAAADYPRKISQVVRKTGFDVVSRAAPHTPIDTGFLIGSATVVSFSDLLVGVYWTAFYAIYQELGTRYMAGNFFATKAVEESREPFIAAIKAINLL